MEEHGSGEAGTSSKTEGRRRLAVTLAALAAVMVVVASVIPGPARAGTGTPGSNGAGDSYFPLYGNGGYDVRRYALDIRYKPATDRLVGDATITAVATKDLSRFNLDFVRLRVSSLTVDGNDATWTRELQHELVVTPQQTLAQDAEFVVRVRYAGVPKQHLGIGGVIRTKDGVVMMGEPEVAAAWFPANDHPTDKATFAIDLTVPSGLEAISNGRFQGKSPASDGWTTWSWREDDPMATYLATAAIGRFDTERYMTADGIRVFDAIGGGEYRRAAERSLDKQERIVRFLSSWFGPYPFDDLGGIVDRIGSFFALETQTRPVYDSAFFRRGPAVWVVVHELAHQWFGNSVSVADWKHIWLNEGFASYAEWLWYTRNRANPQAIFNSWCSLRSGSSFWKVRPGDPGPEQLFDFAVYARGAMTLQALRKEVGTADFFEVLRTWAEQRAGGNGTTTQFIALAESISGMQLDALFDDFLFERGKPAGCNNRRAASSTATTPPLRAIRW